MNDLNLSRWALGHRSLVVYFMLALAIAGVFAYLQLGRSEDPSFTIKTMVIQARWPGATLDDTLKQVTERIERKAQETPGLDFIKSYTVAGQTTVFVNLKGTTSPKATGDAFEHGWFHSGDLGVLHEDGYIELRDRSKDIIISGGENISTIEVESAIIKHPAVANVAVVARPDEKWGETPCAFIVLKPGARATPEELIAHCRANLASYKCPRFIVFRDLPMTSTGKVQKFVLREWAKAV